MTPRQLHALEWAIADAEARVHVVAAVMPDDEYVEYGKRIAAARRALAAGWREQRKVVAARLAAKQAAEQGVLRL